jgi:D-alanyl-D-alanine carboxypeptidase
MTPSCCPDDLAGADLGGAVRSLDARITAERAEADAAAKSLADARSRLKAADAALTEAEHRVETLVPDSGVLVSPGFFGPRSENSRLSALPVAVDPTTVEPFVEARDRFAAEAEKRSEAEAKATAWRDGVNLCGGGYRDPKQQIELRIQNCGPSDYAIYQMPSGSCSPPTAIPGTSMHERGLAIDFSCAEVDRQGMSSRSGPCFGWMAGHAAAFGFSNLPSEPWHWSTRGS